MISKEVSIVIQTTTIDQHSQAPYYSHQICIYKIVF